MLPKSANAFVNFVRLDDAVAAMRSLQASRLQSCFSCLDEIIPMVGFYTRALKLIRDELFDAIHSDE